MFHTPLGNGGTHGAGLCYTSCCPAASVCTKRSVASSGRTLAPAPVNVYVAPPPAASCASTALGVSALVPAVHSTPALVIEDVAPAPVFTDIATPPCCPAPRGRVFGPPTVRGHVAGSCGAARHAFSVSEHSVVSAACPHSGAPSLSVPTLGEGAVHDGTSVQFLLRCTLAERERKMQMSSCSRSVAASQCLPTSGCWMALASPSCSTKGSQACCGSSSS